LVLDSDRLGDSTVVNFFLEASDLHRRAYIKRLDAGKTSEANKYLTDEISLRRRFLEAALQAPASANNDALRRAIVRQISSLTSALALQQNFAAVDKMLANIEASIIDDAAVSVWLQALWSCARFDGQPTNLCTAANRQECRGPINTFLVSVDDMKGRRFPPQTKREIGRLRDLAGTGGCLK
jgi:hypothetical protein